MKPIKSEKKLSRMKFKKDLAKDKCLYIMIAIVMVYFLIFKYIPIFGNIIAFKDYNLGLGMIGSPWAGTKHFKSLFASREFYNVLFNTVILNVYLLIFSFPMPIIVALLLNEIRSNRYKRTIQSILYIPHFISWVVLGGIVISIFSPSSGIINSIIKHLGGSEIYFMADEKWWPVIFVISEIWQSVGWGTIIYLAAIAGVDMDLYEAAIIDGANKWKQTLNITLPSIAPTIVIMLILRMGKAVDLNFEQVYALQNDAVLSVSDVIATYEYRIGLRGMQFSYTTALSLFKGVVGLIFVSTTNYIANKISGSGLW